MRVLITGFEPFDQSPANPSQEVVRRLAETPPDGGELFTAILPVEHRRAPGDLLRAIDLARPQAVVCLGEAGNRMGISIERVAINLIDDRIPDNAGEQLQDQPVVPGGPTAYFSTLPVKAMEKAILAAGVPAELSLSAGTFLCNQVAYTLLHHLATHPEYTTIPAGFIHLPRLPEQAASARLADPKAANGPTMDLETMVRGINAGLSCLLNWGYF